MRGGLRLSGQADAEPVFLQQRSPQDVGDFDFLEERCGIQEPENH